MPNLAQDFGAKLREARKHAELSQVELANRTGTHQAYISLIERGYENPTLSACEKYAEAVGCRLTVVFSTGDEPELDITDLRLLDRAIAGLESMLDTLTRTLAALRARRGRK